MYTGQFVYCGRRATLSIGNARGMCTGQFVYYGHRAMLSIGDVPPLHGILEGAVICNAGHHTADGGAPPLGTTPSSSAATPTAMPPPSHPGNTPSSSAATLTTASGQEALPAKGGT
ncbi:uncharacterized protein [Miscanthus floridulus]|uniref:uncharacterized protein n=1 Tax=Miscanthus floridulus TaxID=154761 RepID=UPI00345B17C1